MRTSDRLALAFTALYVAVAAASAWRGGNHEFVLYAGVLVLLAGLVGWVHARVRLHPACVWCLSAWGLLHVLGGLWRVSDEVGVLYDWWIVPGRLKFDQLVHAYGFGVATWTVWQGMRSGLADPRPALGPLFVAVCGGVGLGALNEVVEFAATLALPETNVGGYENTGWDLVANVVGATVAGVAIRVAGARDAAG